MRNAKLTIKLIAESCAGKVGGVICGHLQPPPIIPSKTALFSLMEKGKPVGLPRINITFYGFNAGPLQGLQFIYLYVLNAL